MADGTTLGVIQERLDPGRPDMISSIAAPADILALNAMAWVAMEPVAIIVQNSFTKPDCYDASRCGDFHSASAIGYELRVGQVETSWTEALKGEVELGGLGQRPMSFRSIVEDNGPTPGFSVFSQP